MNAVIVVATRREQSIQRFLTKWAKPFGEKSSRNGLNKHTVIVVEDHDNKKFNLLEWKSFVKHYWGQDIENNLGDNTWIISRQSSAIKSYGIYKAWQLKPDMIVVLDDDCYPSDDQLTCYDFLEQHYHNLTIGREISAWTSTLDGVKSRGEPFCTTTKAVVPSLSHGLWETNLDLDAPTRLVVGNAISYNFVDQVIPRHSYFAMCGMNIAFKTEIAPLMYFGLQGEKWGVDRFDDIWCGLFMKRIFDHLGCYVSSGLPRVKHIQASSVWANLKKEVIGLEINERLWQTVDAVKLSKDNPIDCFVELADNIVFDNGDMKSDYWVKLKEAMRIWASLFGECNE